MTTFFHLSFLHLNALHTLSSNQSNRGSTLRGSEDSLAAGFSSFATAMNYGIECWLCYRGGYEER